MKNRLLSFLALTALLSQFPVPVRSAWHAPAVNLAVPQAQAPALASRAESSYIDTANTADPNYVAWFNMRRDIFASAAWLKNQGREVLVAWDIDLTLGTPLAPAVKTSLGSDPWWTEQSAALMKAFTDSYGPRKDAEGKLLWAAATQAHYDSHYGQLLQLNNAIHDRMTLVPVETYVPGAIREAQRAGVAMMAVTSRGPDMEAATQQDVSGDLGLYFSLTSPGGASFSMVNFKVNEKARPSTYRRGVLQTSGQGKGEQMLYVFRAAGYAPDVVFFLDDTAKNTKDVFLALRNAGIETHVVRYGYEDARVQEYSEPGSLQPCIAQAQLAAFRASGRFPKDSGVRDARCDAAKNFSLIYGSGAPALD